MYKIYAKTDGIGIVTNIYADIFQAPAEGDTCVETIDAEYDINRHINTMIADMDGKPNYKIVDGKLIERTAEEKAQD